MKRSIAPHAHASADKAARRAAILQAARTLFIAGDGSLPTAAQIASATKLAKGTLYLYFSTKEEIFAALLLAGWNALLQESELAFQTTRGTRAVKVTVFLDTLVLHLELHPELLRLDALGHGVLEKNMLRDALATHKAEYVANLETTGKVIDAALRLPRGRGVQLLMRTYALAKGLWQSHQDAEEILLAGVVVSQSLTAKPFGDELREALQEYWRGALVNVIKPGAHAPRARAKSET